MKFTDALKRLNRLNKRSDYIRYRERHLRSINSLLAIGGIVLLAFWHLFDYWYSPATSFELLAVRIIFIASYIIVLFFTRKASAKYLHALVIAGFYSGALFCTFITHYSGGLTSHYWITLNVMLVAWIIIVPFKYKEHILHSSIFILQYFILLPILNSGHFVLTQMLNLILSLSGTFILGIIVSYNRNMSDAVNYVSQRKIFLSLQKVKKINATLNAEIQLRKETEQSLRESKQSLSSILSNIPIIIWSMDMDGRFISSEGSGLASIGSRAGDRVGKLITELYPENSEVVKFAERALKGEVISEIVNYNGIYFDTRITPLMGENNKQVGLIGMSLDVSEQMRMQESLRQSEEQYRKLVEQARDGIIITQDGKFKFVNKAFCETFEYTREELIERNFLDLVGKESKQQMIDFHAKRMQGEKFHLIYDAVTVSKSGKRIDLELNTSMIEFEGRPASFIITRDISERLRMQQQLKESEERYQLVVEGINDGIFDWNLITDDVYFSKRYKRLLGYQDYEFKNHVSEWKSRLHPEDAERVLKANMDFILNRTYKYEAEYRLMHKDGNYRWILARGTCVRDAFGVAHRMVGTHIDITDRIRLQGEVAKSEQKYRQLFEAESDAIFLIDRETGMILDANPAASNIYGYSLKEFVKLRNVDISAEPEKTKQATKTDSLFIPVRYHKKKDGSIFAVEITASLTQLDNRTVHIITARDITERLKMQEELTKSEQKYRELADFLPQTLYELDNEGRLTYSNRAGYEAFGITKDDMMKPAINLFIPEDRKRMMENVGNTLIGQRNAPANEYTALRKDGKTFPVLIYGVPMLQNEKVIGMRGVIVDISDRKKAENQVREAKEELERLNRELENRVHESTDKLTEANTQLIKLQKENLQSQFEMLKQQVNPHFLFNSLNVLISLIKPEPVTAEKFTEQLSKVYRYVLENKDKELVTVQTELDFLIAYIFLLDIRFMDKLKVNINISAEKREHLILPLAMQLLIENAIKHNAFSRRSPLVINIFVDEKNYLNISNNLQERDSHFASTGVGLKNIESRYSLLTDLKPVFEKNDSYFVAKIPLLD